MSVALAIFVKTPSLSPVKTRLAAGVGGDNAREFYELSLKAVAASAAQVDVDVVWAVGEREGLDDPLWSGFDVMHTGDGDLGTRQAHVYKALLADYERVILIGADAPQISPEILDEAVAALDQHDFVIGPAQDGGYYLFGGRVPVGLDIWSSVPWSVETTRAVLEERLHSEAFHLRPLTDVDRQEDFQAVVREVPVEMSEQQRKLLEWIGKL